MSFRGDRQMQPAHGKTLAKLPPVADTEDHLLEPYLPGYHYIELDLAHHQPMQEVEAEESAISTKSPDGYLSRQLVQHGRQEILRLTGTGTVARPEHTSEIIPGLSYEAHKGMVAGPVTLLGIVLFWPCAACLLQAGRPKTGMTWESRSRVMVFMSRDPLRILFNCLKLISATCSAL